MPHCSSSISSLVLDSVGLTPGVEGITWGGMKREKNEFVFSVIA